MNSLIIVIISFVIFGLAYRFYGAFISKRLFITDPARKTPAHEMSDGSDYVPTRKSILFGHHFVSIAGVSPMVGPAIAVVWGWVPALLWVVLGSIFIGGVHDFASLFISIRRKGRSIGDITGSIITPGTRLIMLLIFFFLLLVVIALFAFIMADLFTKYPASILAIWVQVPLAILFGWLIYSKKKSIIVWSVIIFILVLFTVWASTAIESHTGFFAGINKKAGSYATGIWMIILLIYVFFASTLPVHRLLQPRDYINSHLLYLSMLLLFLGILFARPDISAPSLNLSIPANSPPLFPLLFVTIACGAVSGFHSLVSSGTSSKQLNSESDAQMIGYGGMIIEGVLAVLAIMAVSAGLGASEWNAIYSKMPNTSAGQGAFITGGSNLIIEFTGRTGLGSIITKEVAAVFISVVIICFAGTTLDTATRIQRYVITEIASSSGIKKISSKYLMTTVAVGTAALLAFSQGWQTQTANYLWQVFGTINQLLAAMVLLIVTVFLKKNGRNIIYTFFPMLFLLAITGWAMIWKLAKMITGFKTENTALIIIGFSALILELFVIILGIKSMLKSDGDNGVNAEKI